MENKKIDVIFPAYINAPIGPTGTLRRLLANKDYLQSRGYELNIFTADFLKGTDATKPVNFSEGLNKRSKQKELIKKSAFLSALFQWRAERNAKKLVLKYLQLNRNADIVVFHESSCCYYFLKKTSFKTKVALFHHSNGIIADMLLRSYPKLKWTFYLREYIRRNKYVNKVADANVFISYEGRDNFIQANPEYDKEQIFVFHNGIDDKKLLKEPKASNKKYILCTTGTVCQRKGQYIIIEALHNMDPELRKDIFVSVFGNGQDRQMLEDRVNEYGLTENVRFWGFVPNNEIHDKLSQHNIYILMSNNEGLPISILEAMRAGLGVISTKVSGIPEEVDDRNGILIDPNIEQLTDVFNHINEYDWNRFGQESRKRFEKEFTFDQMMKSYCDMIDKTLEKSRI